MSTILRFFYLLALAAWVGEIAFFSFVAAPAIFRVLGSQQAGQVVAEIFPRYYLAGSLAAAVALLTGAALAGRGAGRLWGAALGCVAVGLAATLYAALVVHPRARGLRVAAPEAVAQGEHAEFQRLHRLAVRLNALSLLAGIAALALSAASLHE